MHRYCNIFLRIILKGTSTEAHVYMRRQGTKVEHFDVSNVIHQKFSHGAVSYTLNGENVNIMLELVFATGSFYCLPDVGVGIGVGMGVSLVIILLLYCCFRSTVNI